MLQFLIFILAAGTFLVALPFLIYVAFWGALLFIAILLVVTFVGSFDAAGAAQFAMNEGMGQMLVILAIGLFVGSFGIYADRKRNRG